MKSVSAPSSSRHQRALPCRRSRVCPARARSRLRLLSSSSLAEKSVSAPSSSRHQRALPCRRSRVCPARARSRLRLLSSSSLADEESVCSLVVQTSARRSLEDLVVGCGVQNAGPLLGDRRVVAVAGLDDRLTRQRQQSIGNAHQQNTTVAEAAPGRAGPAVEEGVPGEYRGEVLGVEAYRPRCVAWGVHHLERQAGNLDLVAVTQLAVRRDMVGELPQRTIIGMQQDRRCNGRRQLRSGSNMIIMGVRAQDRDHPTARNDAEDLGGVVGGVDDDAFLVITDDPDVVLDGDRLMVDRERAGGDCVIDPGRHARVPARSAFSMITTERRTSPRFILSNAVSISPMAILSLTKASNGRTRASPGPGSGTTTVTCSTGAPLLRALIP